MTRTPIDQAGLLDEGRALRALARSLVGGGGRGVVDADDVVQEGELAALRPGGAGRRSAAWLGGTVRNLARMLQRGEGRRVRREQVVAREVAETKWDPAAIAVQAEMARDVATAVQELEEPFRTVVVLRFWNGLLPEAIAERLSVPRNTVRSRLQRGLERLRGRLDAKYGTRQRWAAPLLLLARGREVAGGAVAGGVAGWATLGVLMQAKMLVGAAVLAAAAFVWFAWPRSDTVVTPMRTDAVATAASAIAQPPSPAADSTAPQRVAQSGEVAPAVAEEGPFDPTPVTVPPWSPEFLVVDCDEMPVPGATITIWPGKKVERPADVRQRMGGPRHSYQGREDRPLRTIVTGLDGRAQPVLELENVVAAAAMPGFGDSREALLWHTRAVETRLMLVSESTVRGIVQYADGAPAVGARVMASASGGFDDIARNPELATAGADGRFSMRVQRHGTWVFLAAREGQQTFSRRRCITDDRMEIVLQFPGAIAIAGRVVDATGRAVAEAEVKAWREPQRAEEPAEDDEQMLNTTTDVGGRFVLPVRSFARYQLLASAAGHAASEVVWTETTTENPKVEMQLTLQATVPIRGRVVHEDGQPFVGVRVWAEAELGERGGSSSRPGRDDRFGRDMPTARSAADGTFELAVHPGTTWTLHARPLAKLEMLVPQLRGVAAGASDVEIKITADDLVGCVVRGTVVGIDGSPISPFHVDLVTYGENGSVLVGSSIRIDGNRFETEPLPLGRRYGFWVVPQEKGGFHFISSLGTADVPPFETRAGGVELEVRFEPWGELPVRVLGPGGEPVQNARVRANAKAMFNQSWPLQHVDGAGRVLLRRVGLGSNRLWVVRGASEVVHEQEITIIPGANPELVIRLPR